jgi:hypothetical protein
VEEQELDHGQGQLSTTEAIAQWLVFEKVLMRSQFYPWGTTWESWEKRWQSRILGCMFAARRGPKHNNWPNKRTSLT